MKITYIAQYFKRPDEPGSGRHYEFAHRLVQRGHEVTAIRAGARREDFTVDGIRVIQVPVTYANQMSTARRTLAFALFMAKSVPLAARTPADIVFATSTPLTVVIPGAIAAKVQGARFVLEVRDLWPEAPIALGRLPRVLHAPARLLERVGYARAETVIALSPGMAEGVTRVNADVEVATVPNASDILRTDPNQRQSLRAQLGIKPNETLFIYAGSLGTIYRPTWLAELAHTVQRYGGRLIVAGEGAEREKSETVAHQLEMDPAPIFIGRIPRSQVQNLLRAADVAVSSVANEPTLRHASINKIFDAMGAGLPILANHDGWLSELVADNDAGLVIKELSSETVAPFFDPDWRFRAGQRSLLLAQTSFERALLFEDFYSALVPESSNKV